MFRKERLKSLNNRLSSLDTAVQKLGVTADETPASHTGDPSTHLSTLKELDMRLVRNLRDWDSDLKKEKWKPASLYYRKDFRDLVARRGMLAAEVSGLYLKLAEGKKRFEESSEKPSDHQPVPRATCIYGPGTPDYGPDENKG